MQFRTGIAALSLALLSACSSLNTATAPATRPAQTELPRDTADPRLSALLASQDRVYRVAAPLITKNAPLCKAASRPILGFTAKNKYSYPPELTRAAESTLKLDDGLQVMQVLEGSGAMRAGIRRGDQLQSLQDLPLPRGAQAENEAARIVSPLLKNATEIQVGLIRNGKPQTVQVPLTQACAFAIEVGHAPQVNAYGDGRRIMLTQGMLDFLTPDDELAAIIAREIAHNVQRHAAAMKMAATMSGIIDALLPLSPDLKPFAGSAGLRAVDDKLDQEADRMALYLLARAGYAPDAAQRALQKLAQAYPASVTNGYTALHPWTDERAALLRTTMTEIRQKQSTKKVLVP
ncbi:MAG: hypothetical protein RL404_1249 [Pseudomonadota bacterium]